MQMLLKQIFSATFAASILRVTTPHSLRLVGIGGIGPRRRGQKLSKACDS